MINGQWIFTKLQPKKKGDIILALDFVVSIKLKFPF